MELPETINDLEQLEELLSRPTPAVVESMRRLSGDVMLLGVGGKMGPTLARMARRAADESGINRRIIGVARFSDANLIESLESHGVETIRCDLFDAEALARLPKAENIVYMAARKFGSTGDESFTWAANALLPGLVCRQFPDSRFAAFSTGNVYPLCPVDRRGFIEQDPTGPIGEYAMSCLGRERIFEHFSRTAGLSVSLLRLNYAHDLRYGVLVDLAQKIASGQPIDLTMGYFNALWQGDANAMTLLSLDVAASPPRILNLAGPQVLRVREVCERMAQLMDRPVEFVGQESQSALLSDGSLGHELFGPPTVSEERLIQWTADWVRRGGELIGKPTRFEARDGKF